MDSGEPYGMINPEMLLPELNAALRRLHGAASVLDLDDIDESMLAVMRRLLLAEVLSREWIIAIGGSRGAGKTTLLQTVYGLTGDDAQWLQPNQGQGERLPILVLEEAGRIHAQGFVRLLAPGQDGDFHLQDQELTVEEFQQAARSPLPSYLLPVLKVPSRLFRLPHQGWLLLPGYEPEVRVNKDWQRLMRQALIAAAGCVIVTDATRMADKQALAIVKDMLAHELRGAQAMVVISKTEPAQRDQARQDALRASAQQVFNVSPDAADRLIVCTGADDPAYVAEWLPRFEAAVQEVSRSGGGDRKAQLMQVESLLRRDLMSLLTRIDAKARLIRAADPQGQERANDEAARALEAFDRERTDVRSSYQSIVSKMLDARYSAAWKELQSRLVRNHEGLKNRFLDIFKTSSESWMRLEEDLSQAWESPGSVLDDYAMAVGGLTRRILGCVTQPPDDKATRQAGNASAGTALERLGYLSNGQVQPWTRPDGEDQHNLRVLFSGRTQQGQPTQGVTAGMERAVRLLPTLALEYARLASVMPQVVGVDSKTWDPAAMPARPELVKQALQQLGTGVDLGRTVLRGIAAVLAIDVAVDGELDVPGVLRQAGTAGTSAAGAAGTAAAGVTGIGAAVVGLVAVGYLAYSAIEQTRKHDDEVRLMAQRCLQNFRDQYQAHFMQHFDELLAQVRARLAGALRERYRLDERMMEADRLAKAMADVRALRRDLLDEMGRSAQAHGVFNVTEQAV